MGQGTSPHQMLGEVHPLKREMGRSEALPSDTKDELLVPKLVHLTNVRWVPPCVR